MKFLMIFSLILVSSLLSLLMAQTPPFPSTPNLEMTPGKVCDKPTGHRYAEQVAYCERDVTYETKEMLIKRYDHELGYRIESMNRAEFKIDHFIPLCVGGSNDPQNLWPQHKSIYEVTDPVEPLVCQKMLEGKLLQVNAIELIKRAKTELETVPEVLNELKAL